MKKFTLLFLVLILFNFHGWTQGNNLEPLRIVINGKPIVSEKGISQIKKESLRKVKASDKYVNDYLIVQFGKIPTKSEQQELAKQGVNLLDYVQGNAYFASISPTFYASSDNPSIIALYEIKPEYKISAEVASGEIPDYALSESRFVKLVLTIFDASEKTRIEDDLRTLGAANTRINLKFHQVFTEINPENINRLASSSWVQNIDFVAPPKILENNEGKTSHRANVLSSSFRGLGYNLTGKGIKLGLWDADADLHRDFSDRLVRKELAMHNTDHGTHTAGTIGSAGILDPKARGMAPDIMIYAWNFNTQSNGLTEAEERVISLENDNIDMTSNSWGYAVNSCPNTRAYSWNDAAEDKVAYDYPYFLYVFSAGNSQTTCPDGFRTTSKNLKNSLIVAAHDKTDAMSYFSSFGPAADGRLIPNISGDGVDVYSNYFNNTYGFMSGTSMATPGVAGTMALIYQRYKETHAGNRPLSSMLRALACNTATDFGNPGPDYKFGYGAINGLRAIEVMEQNNYYTNTVSHGTNYSKNIVVPAGAVGLRVMLAWTDKEGTQGTPKALVNDLDLKVINDGNTTLPWVLDPANPNAYAVRGVDNLNNMEQVTIVNPAPGTYTISVDGTLIPAGVQDFAIVYDIVMPLLRITYPIGNETLNPGEKEVIHWDCDGYTQSFSLEYSTDEGLTYSVVASNIPASSRSFLWTVPNANIAKAKFRISNGSTFSTTPNSFSIEATPLNVKAAAIQCDGAGPFALTWDAISNANYKVYKLNGQIFEFLADVTTNSYNISGITPSNENLYCVRAVDKTTGALSERSLAVNVNPSTPVSLLPFSEKFESQTAPSFYFTNTANGKASVQYVTDKQKYGIRFEGTANTTPAPAWVAGTMAACFTNNPTYISKATMCNVDATSFAGKKMVLKFDYRQKWRTAVGTTYFRVKVNGNYVTNTDGTQIYGTTQTINYSTVMYDLSAFAGTNNLSIEFEAVNKTNYTTYVDLNGLYNFGDDTRDKGDFVTIDNVEIIEIPMDVAITAVTPSAGLTNAETIGITIKNLSGEILTNIPVSYKINDGTVINEVMAGPIAAFATGNYTFTQTADFSNSGLFKINARITYPGDINALNDSLVGRKVNNGTDILMPYGVTATPGTGTFTTCGAVFTDNGGRYEDYSLNQVSTVTFKSGIAGKATKITFTEYNTENRFDKLYIYNGPTTTSPLLATLMGSNLPPSFTGTSAGGELTIKFTSDYMVNTAGWVANIECVDLPVNDVAINTFTSGTTGSNAEVMSIRVHNYGNAPVSNIPVSYKVGEGTPVNEIIPGPINAYTGLTYNFTQPVDMSVPGMYTVTASVNYPGDERTDNNSKTITRESDGPGIYRMGVAKGTILTCTGILTDIGGLNGGYPNYEYDTLTVKPDAANKRIKLTITELDLDKGWDKIYIYDGPTVSAATLIATITGENTVVPKSLTSSAANGELTIRFYSDVIETYSGFKATIECVDYVPTTDAGVTAITTPVPSRGATSTIVATVTNFGNMPISNFDVAYKIDANTEVVQNFAGPLLPNKTLDVTFTTKADFSVFNTTYNIDVYTKVASDANALNDKSTISLSTPAISPTNVVSTLYAEGSSTPALISAPALASMTMINNYSFEFWVKPERPATFGRIFDKTNVAVFYQGDPLFSSAYPVNTYVLSVTTSTGSFTYYYPGTVTPGKWQHIAVTVSGTNVYTFYLDGVAQSPVLAAGGVVGATKTCATQALYLGNRADKTRGVVGSIDEVRIWNSALSQATIQSNMNANLPANTAGLIGYYKFTEASGNFVYDYSSNNNTATITGANTTNTGNNQFWTGPGSLLSSYNIVGEKIPTTYDAATNTFSTIMNAADLTLLVGTFKPAMGSVLKVGTNVQTSGVTTNDFSSGSVTYTVEGAGFNTGISQTYTMKAVNDLNDAADLTSFMFEKVNNSELTNNLVLEMNGNNFSVKSGTINTKSLKATFAASTNAKVYINEELQTSPQATAIDYSKPILVKVVAENTRNIKYYSIFLDARNTEASLINFNIPGEQVGLTEINSTNHTIGIWVKNNSNLLMLTPTYIVSPKANVFVNNITQWNSITSNNFTNPLVYDVISEDETSSSSWTVTVTKDVTKPVITLLGNSNVDLVYGDTYTDAGATAADIVDGTITSNIVVSGIPTSTSPVGTYTVRYNITDAAGNAATEVTRTVNVVKAPLTAIAENKTKVYGESNPSLTISYSGFKNGENESVLTTAPIASTTINETSGVGSHLGAITVSGGVDENYDFSYVAGDFTITKATITIEFNNTTVTYDGTAKSVMTTTNPIGLTVNVTYDGSSVAPTNAGSYEVVATIADANYEGTKSGTLTINKATATIDITNTTQQYNSTPRAVTVITNPVGLTVEIKYTGTNVTYPESTIAPSATGIYSVTATINDMNYSGNNTATLTITPSTGVNPNELINVRIYSNSQNIFVEIPQIKGTSEITVYNIIGNQIFKNPNPNEGLNKIEGNFSYGTYVVKVIVGKEVKTQKVIINR